MNTRLHLVGIHFGHRFPVGVNRHLDAASPFTD